MTRSLRRRVLLTVAPLLILQVGLGIGGVWLLDNLGRRSDEIIRENYVSLGAMADLVSQLAGAERAAIVAYSVGEKLDPSIWELFQHSVRLAKESCQTELNTITIPGEEIEARALADTVEELIPRGKRMFFAPPEERQALFYASETGLQASFKKAEHHLVMIRVMNEQAMYQADEASRKTAQRSITGLTMAIGCSLLLASLTIWWLLRTLLKPIRALTDAVTAIGGGQLQQLVPVMSHDELGQLGHAFNQMAVKLRLYRQTNTDRLLRAQTTAQATIDSFPDPVIVLDPQENIEFSNPAAQRLLGIPPAAEGASPIRWVPPETIRSMIEMASRTQRPQQTEAFDQTVLFRTEGKELAFLPQVRPIRSPAGDPLGTAVVLNDVTPFRLLDQLKSDWVATVSHELKTPLTSVQLAVHVLLEEVVGPLEPKQVELLLEARENADRLLKLIQHLLSLARLEDGHTLLDRKGIDPAALLQEANEVAHGRAEDRRIQIQLESDADLPQVQVDVVRFGQALNNLVDNAITYTPPGGIVTLSARNTTENRVEFRVSDTGIGIPQESLPHLFERFYRVPNREETPGTGLGLAIVREVVTAHDGEIRCESEIGKGTTFIITLPGEKREGS